MYKIKQTKTGYDIQLTRGDTFITEVGLEKNGDPYTPASGESIRFAVKHNKFKPDRSDYSDEEPLITITVPTDSMTLTVLPSDTKELAFGEYAWDMELTNGGEVVDTFMNGILTLTPEVD